MVHKQAPKREMRWIRWSSGNEAWTHVWWGWFIWNDIDHIWCRDWSTKATESLVANDAFRFVPVRFFFDSPPSSPFCFFLCWGRMIGNHFSGISFATVILALTLPNTLWMFVKPALILAPATSPQGRGDEAQVATSVKLEPRTGQSLLLCCSLSPPETHTTRAHTHRLGSSLAPFRLLPDAETRQSPKSP